MIVWRFEAEKIEKSNPKIWHLKFKFSMNSKIFISGKRKFLPFWKKKRSYIVWDQFYKFFLPMCYHKTRSKFIIWRQKLSKLWGFEGKIHTSCFFKNGGWLQNWFYPAWSNTFFKHPQAASYFTRGKYNYISVCSNGCESIKEIIK